MPSAVEGKDKTDLSKLDPLSDPGKLTTGNMDQCIRELSQEIENLFFLCKKFPRYQSKHVLKDQKLFHLQKSTDQPVHALLPFNISFNTIHSLDESSSTSFRTHFASFWH
jgi:hypothetical protein